MSPINILSDRSVIEVIQTRFNEIEAKQKELAIQHSQAVIAVGKAMTDLVQFVTQGGLASLLQQHTKAQTVNHLIQGLTSNAGRNGLDARTLTQNAIEGWHTLDAWEKIGAEREAEKNRVLEEGGEVKELDSEEEFRKWRDEQK